MGVPYHKKGVNIISIDIDASQNVINILSGSVRWLEGDMLK